MYLRYYNLRQEPFGLTPDPRFLYPSADHREALAALTYGVSRRKGFVSIVGEVGTGKTTVLRAFLQRLDARKTTAIYIFNPLASFAQILQEIVPVRRALNGRDRIRALQEWLIGKYRAGQNVVVVIDEAQLMGVETLEKLRLLSNLETTQHKLMQIVLAGQPELSAKLRLPALRQLGQRIGVRATIGPLSRQESSIYVGHRLASAGAASAQCFSAAALSCLVRAAAGNPRVLNILCDKALVAGYAYQAKPVGARIAREVVADHRGHARSLFAWPTCLRLGA